MTLKNNVFLLLTMGISSGTILIDRFVVGVPDSIAALLILAAGVFLILHWRLQAKLRCKS